MNPSTDTTLCITTMLMSSPHVLGLPRIGKACRSVRLRLDTELIGLSLRRRASWTSRSHRAQDSTPARSEVSRPAPHTERQTDLPALSKYKIVTHLYIT